MATNKKIVVEFEQYKETPGTVRFNEDVPKGEVSKVRTQYVNKNAFDELGQPERIRVTIEAL